MYSNNKYQFCIRFSAIDKNSAASKAVMDCNQLLSAAGYKDYTFTVGDNSNKPVYYLNLMRELIRFLSSVQSHSIVAIQYPLLSVNKIFPKIIRALRIKKVRFFCIVHDLESLRTGGTNHDLINEEINNLNHYDFVIVHNPKMMGWLREKGLVTEMVSLDIFDYLGKQSPPKTNAPTAPFLYAGNLLKSKFVENLPQVKLKTFCLYGPGLPDELKKGDTNVVWKGEFDPAEIIERLEGSFGLVWDGNSIDRVGGALGKYLQYNNPHKASLYLAAGLPLIAPRNSAIASFVRNNGVGILVDSLKELQTLNVSHDVYLELQKKVVNIKTKVLNGEYMTEAIKKVESALCI